MDTESVERVLSVQSHVVYGYVGGKAAVFPLQCLGYDVDVVNTVHFSNHSGYGRSGGTKATAAELNAVFESMERNELMVPTRLLTGYVPGAEGLSAVAGLARKLRSEKPDLIYLLDPVMGDSGKLYVAADVIPIYRELLPLATIISPNWFEVETLTNVRLDSLQSLRKAISILHDTYHVPHVVISSMPLTRWLYEALPPSVRPPTDEDQLLCITSSAPSSCSPSSAASAQAQLPTVHALCVPLLPGYFSGVGDLFSALLLAHFHRAPSTCISSSISASPSPSPSAHEPPTSAGPPTSPIAHAAAHALAVTQHILRLTHEHALTLPAEQRLPSDDELDAAEPLRKIRRMRGRELRLVQGQAALRGVGVEVRPMQVWEDFWGA
ncbi:putative ribokinase-like protein [Lyophyllum shimeji]|uniref:pyridoxal kinase n=1 Tax=Lyophyllum shimeji TaxID=47721 RepID=A0A9P3PRT0_LYOSH|nr:putative ribokinase-like protein [Lyophyllum shimeji]